MSIRNLYQFFARSRVESYDVSFWIAIGAAGAPSILSTAGNPNLVTSVTRNSAGNLTVLLSDTFPACIHAEMSAAGEPNSDGVDWYQTTFGQIDSTAGTVEILNRDAAGTETDSPNGAIYCCTLRFSSTGSIG